MPRHSHNLAVQDSEQSFPVTKQSLPQTKPHWESLESRARDILINAGEAGKWWAWKLDVSKGQISQWLTGNKISDSKCFQIVRLYHSEIKTKKRSLEERQAAWEQAMVMAHYGVVDPVNF